MCSLQQSHDDVDLEQANVKHGGGGGGDEPCRVPAGSESVGPPPVSSDSAKEIVENNNVVNKDKEERRESNVSECSVEILDLESGKSNETKLNLVLTEKDCRICQLSMDENDPECGMIPIELGCSCKDDLAAAHKQCAEAWFKIKGNKTCEICGSIATNVSGIPDVESTEQWDESNDGGAITRTTTAPLTDSRNFWQGHRFLNFLLACMVFAFVISWLFHFNVPS